MSDEQNLTAPMGAGPAPLIESGMRTGQGDEDGDADTLTIGEKLDGDVPPAPDPAADPEGAAEAVHEAAVVLGDPNYQVVSGENE